MCKCFNCQTIHEEVFDIINHSNEYPDSELKERLEPFIYKRVTQHKLLPISECPDTSIYCERFCTEYMGYGVKASINIPYGIIIGCYLGCIKSGYNVDWKYSFAYALNGYVIDGSDKQSLMSIVNHSRTPNVIVDYHFHMVDDKPQCHIVFIAKRYIHEGEELFIDYGDEYWNWAKQLGMIEITINDIERPLKRQRKITEYFSK